MKTFILYFAKKYVVSALNDLLEKYEGNVQVICETLELWIKRLQVIIEQLKTILSRVSDGRIDSDEVDKSVKEVEALVREWK